MAMRPAPGPRRNLKPDGGTVPPPGTVPAGEDLIPDGATDRPEPTDLVNANKRTIINHPGEPPAPVVIKLAQGQARLLEAALMLLMGPLSGHPDAAVKAVLFAELDEAMQDAVIATVEQIKFSPQR